MRARLRLDVRGRVQGVGFRPAVVRIAKEEGLAGLVGNDSRGAFIEVEGPAEIVDRFPEALRYGLPPLAHIRRLETTEMAALGDDAFVIVPSEAQDDREVEVTPDVTSCEDCLREMRDPQDRRHGYPFINCTNCGPRYSIIRGVPYDRPLTTMAPFLMCDRCQAEYDESTHRRYHAQPNACPVCGPRLTLYRSNGEVVATSAAALEEAVELLKTGSILAVKGLGGVHLACLAEDDAAVKALRLCKGRDAKPFALMAASLDSISRFAQLDAPSEEALTQLARPIVLLKARPDHGLSEAVAPGTDRLGVMLPYTPLHTLLLEAVGSPLVMTSGNRSDEPLCASNEEAFERLEGMAEAFLLHNREIERPIDDSVVFLAPAAGERRGWAGVPLRRARGFVPTPHEVPECERQILALGGDLKAAFSLVKGGRAIVSEHLGDLAHPSAYRHFLAAIPRLEGLTGIKPEVVACDLHPGYLSSSFAREMGLELIEVQHHHAHLASCMADNGLDGEVIGVICDGTGYGSDGTIWGGEVLKGSARDFERVGHLSTFRLLGGDAGAKQTWRSAMGLMAHAYGEDWLARWPKGRGPDVAGLALMARRLDRGIWTSSLGRFLDGVAFLLGVCEENRFEGEAPVRLEVLARGGERRPAEALLGDEGLDFGPWLRRALDAQGARAKVEDLALSAHLWAAKAFSQAAIEAAQRASLDRVVLSGGAFVNAILLGEMTRAVEEAGLRFFAHRDHSPGDGGLSLGQARVAIARIRGM